MEKILIMGIDTATKFIVEEAKKKGIYTILTDYQPVETCPLKKTVDEAWFLNVGDLDALEAKCREEGVTAVIAGNHEFCLDSTKALCRRLGLPFYANDTCWNAARDKAHFKKLCRKCGVPVAKDYSIDGPITYPVCVKPSDSCAQRGLSIVSKEEDLQAAYEKALSFSENKKIIIEQVLTGQEVMLVGYADQGDYHLLYAGDIYSVICAGKPCISMGPNSPARAKEITERNGAALRKLLTEMDHQNGLFILQGFAEEDGNYYLLEPGIRFDGAVCCQLAAKIYDINPVGWMIDLARGLKPEIDWSGTDITDRRGCYASHVMYCNPGTIAKIEGVEWVRNLPNVELLLNRFKVGDTVKDVGNMTQCAFYMHMTASSPSELIDTLKCINSTLRILDEEGNSLLIYETEYDKILNSMSR